MEASGVLHRQIEQASQAASIGVRSIALVLQGGGTHGAFAWGVLDRLLEEEAIEIDAVSATSMGAVNAVILAYGEGLGGRDGARQALAGYWRRVAHMAAASPMQATWWDRLMGNGSLDTSPAYLWAETMSRIWSPYQANPTDFNPLREALLQSVDFEVFASLPRRMKVFLTATNVRTGQAEIFADRQISAATVMAASCVPHLCQAVEIAGEHYWDGAFAGQKLLLPLTELASASDIAIVRADPVARATLPLTSGEITNRVIEIAFNTQLASELAVIERRTCGDRAWPLRVHSIDADSALSQHAPSSRMNADWDYLLELRDLGRDRAERWLLSRG